MAIAQGVAKQTRFKRQAAKGTIATTSAGQILRRTTSTFELKKDTFNSKDEITSTQQLIANRHGAKQIDGSVNGLLSPGTYSDLVAALLRRDYAAITVISGASITIAGAGPYTLTDGANTFLTKGVTVGSVVRLTAGSFNAANLNLNLFVTAVTQTVITVLVLNGAAMVAEGPIAAASITLPGKTTYAPITGFTSIYYTFEEWYPDITRSEYFQDCRVGKAQFSLPGQGNATVQFDVNGLNMLTSNSAAYFTSPTTETSYGVVVGASGLLLVGGTAIATITDLQFTIDANQQVADPVVGSTVRPDVFVGKIMVTGQFTAYFDTGTLTDYLVNETNVAIISALTSDLTNASDFIAISLPQVNVNTASPQDGETGNKRTYQFVAEYFSAGGAALNNRQTTIQIQDSQAT
jgi:hypothetical protein